MSTEEPRSGPWGSNAWTMLALVDATCFGVMVNDKQWGWAAFLGLSFVLSVVQVHALTMRGK